MIKLPDAVRSLIEGTNYGHVATLLPDGSPHTVPVWVAMEGDRVAFLTGPRSQKALNLGRDPRLAISITDREKPNRMAQVRGRVIERVEGDRAWRIIDRMSEKYLGTPYPLRSDRVVYLMAPEHASGQEF